MKLYLVIAFVSLLAISSCGKNSDATISQKATSDTIIGTKEITNELPGSNYRKRAKGYFLIINQDTSKFMPIAGETNQNDFSNKGRVWLNLNSDSSMSYREQIAELSLLFPHIFRDFKIDSLKSISLGRLEFMGDLAIITTKQLSEVLKTEKAFYSNYKRVQELLKKSKLGEDFNAVLKPYNLVVGDVWVEKVMFTDKKYLYQNSKIETDSTLIPNKILDCMIGIRIKRADSL
ncbi:MAG: hypothetical protein V4642_12100 [Bacteroidota bacterium]